MYYIYMCATIAIVAVKKNQISKEVCCIGLNGIYKKNASIRVNAIASILAV